MNSYRELISDVVDGTGLNGWDYDRAAAASSSGVASRPVLFTKDDNSVSVECTYDYMGRRATKKVTQNGTVTLHQRYLYRGYLQIACCDLLRSNHPCLWLITWDPSQSVATRPLAIQKDGTWYTYGWDLTKNICEVYGQHGYMRTSYTYTPYGIVGENGDVSQNIQFSSEYADSELNLVYFRNRYYIPTTGTWLVRDFMQETESDYNRYSYVKKSPLSYVDINGDWAFAMALPLISTAALVSALASTAIVVAGAIAVYAVGVGAIKAVEWASDKYRRKKCEKLQRQKHEAKKAVEDQACKGDVPCKPKVYQCLEYMRRKRLFERLASAREAYDRECFGGSDEGHDEAIKIVAENAIKNCNEKYVKCKKKLMS